MTTCESCGGDIRANEDKCGRCGARTSQSRPVSGCLAFVTGLAGLCVLLVVIAFLRTGKEGDRPVGKLPERSREDMRFDAAWEAQLLVKARLKAPSTADFQAASEAHVLDLGDEFDVTSYVDAQNSFGAKLRQNFIVKLRRDGEKWKLLDLEMLP
jgi:hypothetical protein